MSYYSSDINVDMQKQNPIMLIDESPVTGFYVGISNNGNNQNASSWRITRIWKVEDIWYFGYPNADQGFKFIWGNRNAYVYQQ
jgi:hypothetical protein